MDIEIRDNAGDNVETDEEKLVSRGIIVSGGVDKQLSLWNSVNAKLLKKTTIKELGEKIFDIGCLKKIAENSIVCGCSDGILRHFELTKRHISLKNELIGHEEIYNIDALDYDERNHLLVSGGHDYSIKTWDLRNLTEKKKFGCLVSLQDSDSVSSVQCLPRNMVASANVESKITIHSLEKLTTIFSLDHSQDSTRGGKTTPIYDLDYDETNNVLFSCSTSAKVISMKTKKVVHNLLLDGRLYSLLYLADSNELVVGCTHRLYILDLRTMKLRTSWCAHSGGGGSYGIIQSTSIRQIINIPDQHYICSGSTDSTIKIWNYRGEKSSLVRVMNQLHEVCALTYLKNIEGVAERITIQDLVLRTEDLYEIILRDPEQQVLFRIRMSSKTEIVACKTFLIVIK